MRSGKIAEKRAYLRKLVEDAGWGLSPPAV